MPTLRSLTEDGPIAVNLGLLRFAKALQEQGRPAIHVNWSPPPEVDEEMQDILDQLL